MIGMVQFRIRDRQASAVLGDDGHWRFAVVPSLERPLNILYTPAWYGQRPDGPEGRRGVIEAAGWLKGEAVLADESPRVDPAEGPGHPTPTPSTAPSGHRCPKAATASRPGPEPMGRGPGPFWYDGGRWRIGRPRPNPDRPGPDAAMTPSRASLQSILERCGIRLEPGQYDRLWAYHRLLRAADAELNLTRIRNFENMVLKHYADSLLVLRFQELPSPLVDMGSGPGLPGIPLKIARPEVHMILAEPRGPAGRVPPVGLRPARTGGGRGPRRQGRSAVRPAASRG